MASDLYSRYLPPKNKKIGIQAASTSTSVASKASPSVVRNAPLEHSSLQDPSPRRLSTQSPPPSSLSTLKRKPDISDGQLEDRAGMKRSKGHKSLLLKRDKSTKKSEKLIIASENAESEDTNLEIHPLQSSAQPDEEVHPLQPIPQPKPVPNSEKEPIPPALPPWLAAPIRISTTTTSPFTELGIPEHVSHALKDKGFDYAFAVQTALLPLLLTGNRQHPGDILVSAATGSGKTLGYALPMIADISRTSITRLRGLIIVPTRDLVYQAHEICEICASAFAGRGKRRVKIGMACGDMPYKQELASLMRAEMFYNPAEYRRRDQRPNVRWGSSDYDSDADDPSPSKNESGSTPIEYITNYTSKVDILVCTPGRLVQHLHQTDGFGVDHTKYLVIDEADRLFSQGYQGWLKDIMASLGKGAKRKITKILLSATVTQDLGVLSALNLESPRMVFLEGGRGVGNWDGTDHQEKYTLPNSLQEYYIQIQHQADKPLELLRLMNEEGMLDESSAEKRGVLIFTNSNEAALRLGRLMKLMDPDIAVGTLTSTMPAKNRKKTLRDFQLKKLSVVVASDLVSRGLDIPSLAHVVNYDFPTTREKYIHRVGRTARAGKGGKAWTLHTAKEIQTGMVRNGRSVDRPDFDKETRNRYEAALAILAKEAGRA